MSEALNLDAMTAANLLVWLKAECEAQHDRADQAEAEVERLRAVLGSRGVPQEAPRCCSAPTWTAIWRCDHCGITASKGDAARLTAVLRGVPTPQGKLVGDNPRLIAGTPQEKETKMAEWQPIETAPKDGSWMVLGSTQMFPVIGQWSEILDDWQAHSMRQRPTHWVALPQSMQHVPVGTPHQEEKAAPK